MERQAPSKTDLAKRLIGLILFLYLFLVSIKLMGASFKEFSDVARDILEGANNPFIGLFIGILATSLVQSSSTTTSTVITMVAAGLIDLRIAIPMIMGANIGTSVTNTIVSLGNIGVPEDFRRAFSASTIHDFFNIMAVLIFFPLELATGFLTSSATSAADMFAGASGAQIDNFFKLVLNPAVDAFKFLSFNNALVMLLIALGLLFISLKNLSNMLRSIFVGALSNAFDKYVFHNAITSFLTGLILTVLVQSSSISTSLIVPIAAAGLVNLPQILPFTIGANIGTTTTGMLAALASGVAGNTTGVIVAFAHLLFNVFGALIIYPMKKIPIAMAEKMAELAIKNKAIPVIYIITFFFLLPLGLYFISQ